MNVLCMRDLLYFYSHDIVGIFNGKVKGKKVKTRKKVTVGKLSRVGSHRAVLEVGIASMIDKIYP